MRARVRGLFCSQNSGSKGLPKTPPKMRFCGLGAAAVREEGILPMRAALWAETEEKSGGWRKARWSAP